MKKVIIGSLVVVAMLALMVGPATAGKPSQDGVFNGNGYPSGEHFNLNLIAKPDHFQCPDQSYYLLEIATCPGVCGDYPVGTPVEDCPDGYTCVPTDPPVPMYGNVVFIPREQGQWCDCGDECDAITILMESGRKGPKPKAGIGGLDPNVLQVIDWCTEYFPDNAPGDEGSLECDSANVRLPKHLTEDGYLVYARLTGKPGEEPGEPTFTIRPDLVYVEDFEGRDLLLLMGLVASNGALYTWQANEWTLVRTDGDAKGKGGKGVQKAQDITALFRWSGRICYFDETDCVNSCTHECWCCCDTDSDGADDHCAEGSFNDNDTPLNPDDDYCDCSELTPPADCTYAANDLFCTEYVNHWIFDIADFVGYLWDIDTTGAYVVKVRFYPLGAISE